MMLGNRADGFRVQYFGAKIRQLHGFLISQLIEQYCTFHLIWIGIVHTVNIGPDLATLCIDTGRKHCSRII